MASIQGRQFIPPEVKRAEEHGVLSVPMHDAPAARFDGSVVAIVLFQYLVVALVNGNKITLDNLPSTFGIKCRRGKAGRIAEGVIPEFDHTWGLLLSPDHPQPVGIARINRVSLFQKDGSGPEMVQWAITQKDVGIERWVVEGLLLIAVFPTEQAEKTTQGGSHLSSAGLDRQEQ